MNATARPVVVGVDGTASNRGALRYAIEEARRTGGLLKLAHVVPDLVPVTPMLTLVPGDLTEAGTAVLTRVEHEAHEQAPDVPLESWLHHGNRASELVKAAEGAGLVVVGRDDRSILHRLMEGETASRTASRSSVPVAVVPDSWHDDPGGGADHSADHSADHGVVLVGVKSPAHADPLLGTAFAAARARAAKLVVLHAWHLPSAYDDIIEGRVAVERVERDATAQVRTLTASWSAAYPDVEVEVRVVHAHPAQALVEESRAADLVVIVRRAHGVPPAGHLGGTARALLRSAACPVLVVSPHDVSSLPPLVLETEGHLLT